MSKAKEMQWVDWTQERNWKKKATQFQKERINYKLYKEEYIIKVKIWKGTLKKGRKQRKQQK